MTIAGPGFSLNPTRAEEACHGKSLPLGAARGPLSLGFPRARCQPVWPHREVDNGPAGPSGSGFLIPVAPGSDHMLVPGSLGS